MVDIIAGIYEDTVEQLAHKISLVEPHLQWVQVDISDGTLVPKTSVTDIERIGSMISDHPKLSFEAHLMVADPQKYIKKLVDAGFKRVIAHVECTDPRLFLDDAEYESVEVGLAIDAPTELEQLEPYIESLDFVLVMTGEAGASGQAFMSETAEKIRAIRENHPDLPVEVDAGINNQSAKVVRDAGATRLVSTSYLFSRPEQIDMAVAALRKG